MPDQGYPSKRHRGGDQPRRTKRSHGQPHATPTSTQTVNPMIPQGYSVVSQPLTEPALWGEYDNTVDWQQDGSDKLGSISSPATSYLNADTPTGDNAMGGYVMVQNLSSGAYSSGSGSNQTSEEASEQGQQAYYSPPWTPGTELVVDAEAMQTDCLSLPPHEPHWMLSDLDTNGKVSRRVSEYALT